MPKKTKKEKLLAQQHRSHVASVVNRRAPESHTPPATADTRMMFSLPKRVEQPTGPGLSSAHEFMIMKRDLIKTVVLTLAVLISEFLLAKSLPQ